MEVPTVAAATVAVAEDLLEEAGEDMALLLPEPTVAVVEVAPMAAEGDPTVVVEGTAAAEEEEDSKIPI